MSASNIPRGRPAFADSQREKILQLLQQAGPAGVPREDLIFKHKYTQAGTRIFELEEIGYVIRHESRPGRRFIVYVLESEPRQLKPVREFDWYEKQTGKQRPEPLDSIADLPLFGGARS